MIACVGGGSNAMGIFYPYIAHADVRLIGVEAARRGHRDRPARGVAHRGRPGVLHGNRTYLLQDANGQIIETHSISAGLDYPGVGPEHAWLKDSGRAEYVVDHRRRGARGVPRLLPHRGHHSRARVVAMRSRTRRSSRRRSPSDKILLVNLSGRGDKDMHTVAERSGLDFARSTAHSGHEPHRRHVRAAARRTAARR